MPILDMSNSSKTVSKPPFYTRKPTKGLGNTLCGHMSWFESAKQIATADHGVYYELTTGTYHREIYYGFQYDGQEKLYYWPRPGTAMKGKLVTKPRRYARR